jgi:hypothetical protein
MVLYGGEFDVRGVAKSVWKMQFTCLKEKYIYFLTWCLNSKQPVFGLNEFYRLTPKIL